LGGTRDFSLGACQRSQRQNDEKRQDNFEPHKSSLEAGNCFHVVVEKVVAEMFHDESIKDLS
jgi:hypothetical protein